MSRVRLTLIVLLLLLCAFGLTSNTLALETGLNIDGAEEIDPETFFTDIEIVRIDEVIDNLPFEEFAIGPNAEIAVEVEGKDHEVYIYIFSDEGDFVYGYHISHITGAVSIEWEDKDLMLFFHRSNVILTCNEFGECTNALRISKEAYAASASKLKNYTRTTTLDGVKYKTGGNPLVYGGKKTLTREADGESVLIYQGRFVFLQSPLVLFGGFVLCAAYILAIIIISKSKSKNTDKGIMTSMAANVENGND